MGSDLEGDVPPWPSGGLTLAWIRFTATASLGREAVATSRAKSVRVIVNRAASAACCTLT